VVDNDFQIHLNALNQPFGIEHFDSLSNAGNANSRFPRGIYIHELGSAADNLYGAQNGSSFSGNTYSFGATGSAERSLGGLTTGSVSTIYVGARFQNNTGQPINALKVSYTGEQWRCGGNGLGDTLFFQVSTNADSLHTGTWTTFPALNFSSPYVDTVAVALDGNLAPNFTFVSDTAANLGIIQPGQTVWIRWSDLNVAGSDDALGIDNMSVEPLVVGCLPATVELQGLVSPTLTGEISYANPIPIAQEMANRLKYDFGCHCIILLSHLGYSYSGNQVSDLIVAEQTENIDLIIGGHTHTFLNKPTPVKNLKGNLVLVSQAGWAGLLLGRIDILFSPKGHIQSFDSAMNEISKKTIGL
jgi:hypothetical protein